MAKITDADFELFFRLASLNQALTLSAVDPVVLDSEDEAARNSAVFRRQFYDTFDDKEGAMETMRIRIERAEQDIRQHFIFHQSAADEFKKIGEGVDARSRLIIYEAVARLSNGILDYKDLVKSHRRRFGEDAFLTYLSCMRGHYFVIKGDNRVLELSFNPRQTCRGLIEEMCCIGSLADSFRFRQGKVPYVKIDEYETGEGLGDKSLGARLELNKELLKRAGLVVSN